jgi:hypothetical protein
MSPPHPQPLLQLLQPQPHLLLKIASSKPPRQQLWHFGLQQRDFLQHDFWQPHEGAASHPQLGAGAGASQPHFDSQPQPLLHPHENMPRKPANKSQPHPQLLHGSQHFGLQHFGLQHFGLQHLGLQHEVSQPHFVSQPQLLSHPHPPLTPNMRSKSSKLKPWVHKLALTTSAPKYICHFIESRLP